MSDWTYSSYSWGIFSPPSKCDSLHICECMFGRGGIGMTFFLKYVFFLSGILTKYLEPKASLFSILVDEFCQVPWTLMYD